MSKKIISLFLSIIFLGLITAPSIIAVLDENVDISILYSVSEEEEENKNLKIVVSTVKENTETLTLKEDNLTLGYLFKVYSNPHLNLISPPPEQTYYNF